MTNVAEYRLEKVRAASPSKRFAPSLDRDRDEAGRPGLLGRIAAACLTLLRADLRAAPQRPLAHIRAKRNAIGFPYRATPAPRSQRRDYRCDCVPL
jgi:hypothetical protein